MGRAGLLEPVQSLSAGVKNTASGSLRRCTSSPPPRPVCGLHLAAHSDSRAFAPHSPTQPKPSTSQPDGWHGPIRLRQVAGIGSLSAKTFIARYFARTLALPNTCSAPKNKPQSKASSRPCPAAASTCPTSATKTPTPAPEPNAPPSTPPCKALHPTSSNAP